MMGSEITLLIQKTNTIFSQRGGESYKIAVSSKDHINPFDLPIITTDETVGEVFRGHVLNLISLIKILLGGLSPTEEVVIDQAVTNLCPRNIDVESDNARKYANPEDLTNVLNTMEGGANLAAKLYKYTKGTYGQFLNHLPILYQNKFVVFNINEEEELRPIAVYLVIMFEIVLKKL